MKKFVYKYQTSKFKRFVNGLLFALITCGALILCLIHIYYQNATKSELVLPFIIAIISIIMGFFTMFHTNDRLAKKYAS